MTEMFSENNKISVRQLQALLILDIFGTGVITLPRTTASIAGNDGWVLILGAGVIVFAVSMLIHKTCMMYPTLTFSQLTNKILSKPIGVIICLGFGLKIVIATGLELRIFCAIVRQTMLETTPIGITACVLLSVAIYIGWCGFECRGRVAEILFIILGVTIIFIFGLSAINTDFSNLKPIFSITPKVFIKGSAMTAITFSGIELLLIGHYFVADKENVGKGIGQAIIVLVFAMAIISAITIARFGVMDVKAKLWPVLQMMDTIDIPGAFIERQDIFILRFWIISIFFTINAGIFISSLLFAEVAESHESRRSFLIGVAIIVFVISQIPKDIGEAYATLNVLSIYGGVIFSIIVPIILIGFGAFKKRGDQG